MAGEVILLALASSKKILNVCMQLLVPASCLSLVSRLGWSPKTDVLDSIIITTCFVAIHGLDDNKLFDLTMADAIVME